MFKSLKLLEMELCPNEAKLSLIFAIFSLCEKPRQNLLNILDIKHFFANSNQFQIFQLIQICSKGCNCVKIDPVWLENFKVTT